jgi:DNA-binding NtrC family response regulator
LRDRREDVPVLAQVFLDEFSRERAKAIEGFTDPVLELLEAYPWPGNVRELRNVVERAVLFCRGPRITIDELPAAMRGSSGGSRRASTQPVMTLQQAVERAEIEAIRSALAATQGRRSEAAARLGVSRKTLWEKIKTFGIVGDE